MAYFQTSWQALLFQNVLNTKQKTIEQTLHTEGPVPLKLLLVKSDYFNLGKLHSSPDHNNNANRFPIQDERSLITTSQTVYLLERAFSLEKYVMKIIRQNVRHNNNNNNSNSNNNNNTIMLCHFSCPIFASAFFKYFYFYRSLESCWIASLFRVVLPCFLSPPTIFGVFD